MPTDPAPLPAPRRATISVGGVLVVSSLLLNLLLAVWLWQIHAALGQRLDRLETLSAGHVGPVFAAPGASRQASRNDRLAFLLAAAGNADESKKILAAISPEDATEIARTLIARPAANDRNEALDATLRYLAADNAPRAIRLLADLEDSGLKDRLARHIVAVWTATAPDAVARWLTDEGNQFFEPGALNAQLAVALAHWSAFAPEAAARFIDARPSDGDLQPTPNSLALGQACLEWSRRDTAAALAWTQSLPATDPRQPYALDGVLQAWTEADPGAASSFVRQGMLTAPQTSGAGPQAIIVVQSWSAKDPDAAARWAMTLPDPAVRGLAMREAAARWAQTDPVNAARWAESLPSDRARAGVWVGMTERWTDADPARVETWLTGLPASRDRDEATAVYIGHLAPNDPEKALTWARTLTGPGFAADQVGNVLAEWEVKDTAAARNWAAANGVALPSLQGGR